LIFFPFNCVNRSCWIRQINDCKTNTSQLWSELFRAR